MSDHAGALAALEEILQRETEADQVLRAIDQQGANVRVGYSRRYKERYLIAKEQLAQCRMGQLIGGAARISGDEAARSGYQQWCADQCRCSRANELADLPLFRNDVDQNGTKAEQGTTGKSGADAHRNYRNPDHVVRQSRSDTDPVRRLRISWWP